MDERCRFQPDKIRKKHLSHAALRGVFCFQINKFFRSWSVQKAETKIPLPKMRHAEKRSILLSKPTKTSGWFKGFFLCFPVSFFAYFFFWLKSVCPRRQKINTQKIPAKSQVCRTLRPTARCMVRGSWRCPRTGRTGLVSERMIDIPAWETNLSQRGKRKIIDFKSAFCDWMGYVMLVPRRGLTFQSWLIDVIHPQVFDE